MEDFESFKEARLKMDPTARKMSAARWKRAYEAHLQAKKRVAGSRRDSQETEGQTKGSGPRRSRGSRSGGAAYGDSVLTALRRTVRDQSAYADLRFIVDILAWVALAVVILSALVPLFFNTPIPVSLGALLDAVLGVVGILVARLLAQVFIDIPDIALYRALSDEATVRSSTVPNRNCNRDGRDPD